jgi:hypothetical protein
MWRSARQRPVSGANPRSPKQRRSQSRRCRCGLSVSTIWLPPGCLTGMYTPGALYMSGQRCSHGRLIFPAACRIPAAWPLFPVSLSAYPGSDSRGVLKGSLAFARPVFSLPVAPGQIRSLGFFPERRTLQLPATHVRAETNAKYPPGTTHPTRSDLLPEHSLDICHLVSHRPLPSSPLRRLVSAHHLAHARCGVPGYHRPSRTHP